MSLAQYNKKRKFDKTPEPSGTVKSSKGPLTFVIQRHLPLPHAATLIFVGGTVMVWDKGVYMPYDGKDRISLNRKINERNRKPGC